MKLNHLVRLGIFPFLLLLLIACNSNISSTDTLSSDAEITTFKLSDNTSVMENLANVFFTIDQNRGLIYNADSLPVGTKVKKLLASISFASALKATIHYPSGDSASYSSSDSIDFSSPFTIKIVAYDGLSSKTYDVRLNIHKQEPDSLNWQKISGLIWDFDYSQSRTIAFKNNFLTYFKTSAGFLLSSSLLSDGAVWTPIVLNNTFPATADINSLTEYKGALYLVTADKMLYKSTDGVAWSQASSETGFIAILGVIKAKSGLDRLMVQKNNGAVYSLAYSQDGIAFTSCGDNSLPSDFPVKDFSVIVNPGLKSNKLTVIGGVSATGQLLNTVHQMYWDQCDTLQYGYNINNNSDDNYTGFSPRKGPMAFYYDNKMFLASGESDAVAFGDLYTSQDNGITWQRKDSVMNLPQTFIGRSNASVYVSSDNFISVFGGTNNNTPVKDIWRGRINRYGSQNK